MRKKYGEFIYCAMRENSDIISVVVDSGTEELDKIREEFPERLIECGIAEANAVGVAAGLASCGAIPILYGMATFLVYRGFEFIRDDVCLQNMNVKIVGSGGGVGYNNLGPTHHSTEDLGILRCLPNLTILSPASPLEVAPIMRVAIALKGPVYIRFGKAFEEEIYTKEPEVAINHALTIRDGRDVALLCTGSVISDAIDAAQELEKKGIHARVININCLKPVDEKIIIKAAKETRGIITIEEHNVIGGLGTIVSEVLSKYRKSTILIKIGFQDTFCMDYGWRQDLRKMYGISKEEICCQTYKLLSY